MTSDETKRLQTQAVRALQAADGKKAMAEYEASAAATRSKTERLRALRLAKEAVEGPAVAAKSGTKSGTKAGTKSGAAKPAKKAAKGKGVASGNLASWVKSQKDGGHNY